MEMNTPVVVSVLDPGQAGEARRVASSMAARSGFDAERTGRLALVVTEAATNLLKHAKGGEIHLRPRRERSGGGIEVVALDRGPGMRDPDACLRDGFTTGKTPGTGLGAIRRMSARFDVYSDPGGTALLSLVSTREPAPPILDVGVMSVPHPAETVCGDAWTVVGRPPRTTLFVVDGLGHGSGACEAAQAAVESLESFPEETPARALERMHARLAPTRGVAAAIAQLDLGARRIVFSGIGNIAGSVCSPDGIHSMVSQYGTLGHDARRFQEFTYPWPEGGVLVLHSDGIGTRWDLARYPGLFHRHPSLIAAILYRDFRRERDDATVLVARERV